METITDSSRWFRSKVLPKDECGKIEKDLGEMKQYPEKMEYIFNFYDNNRRLRLIFCSSDITHPITLLDMFTCDGLISLIFEDLIFEEIQ